MPTPKPLRTVSFSNLHISPQGWFLAGHQPDGSMRQWDMSKTSEQRREHLCRLLVEMIEDPAAVLSYETKEGIQ